MEFDICTIAFAVGAVISIALSIEIKFRKKVQNGELNPEDFKIEYILPAIFTFVIAWAALQEWLAIQVVPDFWFTAFGAGIIAGSAAETVWKRFWEVIMILFGSEEAIAT
jgi:hypothetical protein